MKKYYPYVESFDLANASDDVYIEDSAAIMDIQNILDKFAKKLETVSTEDLQAQLLSYPVSNSEMAALDYLDKSNAKGG